MEGDTNTTAAQVRRRQMRVRKGGFVVADQIIVCGGTECVTCGRDTEVFFGPCPDCCETYERTGKFPRRKTKSEAE